MGLADYTLPPPPDQRVADPGAFMGIAIEGVSKAFGPKQVLDGTDLLIHKGETLVVIGRSGEGKSVLLKNIVRLLEPEAGRIWIEGVEVTDDTVRLTPGGLLRVDSLLPEFYAPEYQHARYT